MKYTVILFAISFSLNGFAQYFTVSDIVVYDPYELKNVFPLVKSNSNSKAADKINTFLQFTQLKHIIGSKNTTIFSTVFPTIDNFMGQTGFEYTVHRNDETFFSVSISYENTGAYTSLYTDYYTFISKTGEHVLLDDFFTQSSLSELGEMVNNSCIERIQSHMESLDTTIEQGAETYEMYDACIENRIGNNYINTSSFRMEKEAMVFIIEQCSNHAMAALDELYIMEEKISYQTLSSLFNENALEAYTSENWGSKGTVSINEKILSGFINNRYPITAKIYINNIVQSVHGAYWYNKVKGELSLTGTIDENGKYKLREYNSKDEITGFFEGEVENGIFSGIWSNKDRSKSMPFTLAID